MDKKTIKNLVLEILQEKKISQADLTNKLKISSSTANSFFHNDSLTVERLMQLSVAFDYNFLNELSQTIPVYHPSPVDKDGNSYVDKIHDLEIENQTLRKLIAEMAGKYL